MALSINLNLSLIFAYINNEILATIKFLTENN